LYRAKLLARRRTAPPYTRAERPLDEGAARREEVEQLARELGVYIEEYMNGSLYNPPLHPAFANFPTQRESETRYDLIRGNAEASSGRVLDIGCHIGAYFASRFDDDGYQAVALDENVVHAHFSKRLTALRNPDVEVVWDSLFTWAGRNGPFDIVTGLNVFHHMLKEPRLFNRLRHWLRELRAEELFVQVPDQETPMWDGVCKWLTGEEWAQLIVKDSRFDQVEILGRPTNDRPLYHFSSA
jgi:hypothetical protein